jgi:diguanylate cyclase (GGDEF)-like protein/PAS domain S-box-containing protein
MKGERLTYAAYLLAAVAGVMAVVFLNFAAQNVKNHERDVRLLGHLQQLETELTQQVLLVTSFRLVQYDGLVTLTHELQREQDKLNAVSWVSLPGFEPALAGYMAQSTQRLHLLEHIKSNAAFLRNAHQYLPNAVAALGGNLDQQRRAALHQTLVRLFRYTLSPTRKRRKALDEQIAGLGSTTSQTHIDTGIDTGAQPGNERHIVKQMEANVRITTRVSRDLDEFLGIPVSRTLDHIEALDEARFAAQSARVRRLSLSLLILTTLLFIGLGYAIHRLRGAQQRSAEAWKQLRDAIESLSESFALFDKSDRLQMWNRNYERDYPTVAPLLHPGLTFSELARAMVEHQQFATAGQGNGGQGNEDTLKALIDHYHDARGQQILALNNGRHLLSTTSITSDGGRALVGVDISAQKQVEAELRKLSQAVEQSPVSVVITDLDGTIEYVNPKFEHVTGYSARDAIGHTPRILKSAETDPALHVKLWETITRGETWQGEFHNRREDGRLYWESAVISPIRDEAGNISHYIAVKEDITARKQAEEQLRLAATVFEKTREGLLVTDADNHIKAVNPAFCTITGYSADDVLGRDPRFLSSGRQSPEFYQAMWATLASKGHWEGEIWNRRKSGEIYAEWLSLTAIHDRNDDTNTGRVEEYVAVFSDITQRLQDEERIRHQANYDSLTELPNRSLLLDRLGTAIAEAKRKQLCIALLFVDLDRFKPVNDSLGHQAGDDLLRQVARRLTDLVRGNDTVARLSGDEFVLILNGLAERKAATGMAERVNRSLAKAFEVQGQEVFIGSSIGISVYPKDTEDASTLLRNADMAMYRAKEAGRGTYRFFTSEMDAYIAERLSLERDMRKGMDNGEFLLHYQPIVNPYQLRLYGAEVLVRWQHPRRGLLGPDQFISLAEDTGMIGALGEWVLRSACEQGRRWLDAGLLDFSLSVNLSGRQMRGGLSCDLLAAILEDSGFPAQQLTLEITEGILLEGTPETVTWLQDIKALGVTLALDDFGTGYSSLSYLKRFPIDIIKIDRSFISGIVEQPDDRSLTEAILAMARSLRMRVVAEGVETSEQLKFLAEHRCDSIQGYFFSRPLAAIDLPGFRAGLNNGEFQAMSPGKQDS